MIVEPANTRDVAHVAVRMRERDVEEIIATSHFTTKGELVSDLVQRFGEHQDVFVVYGDPGPVAVVGMLLHRPNVGTLLFFATDDFDAVGSDFVRFVVQRWFPAYKERGVHRIECTALESYDEVHRWLDTFGLKREAVMPKFGRGGETYVLFSWVAE